ncbi:MAG: histidine kinase [Lachnospiraceae bacterium]|jgi:Mor family transcriptional regulator|nr:histidine kinase [Lachnospiraceae bacterium]
MSYIRAEKILPLEIVELIQNYVDGENIYIPRKENNKKVWGNDTKIRQELKERNLLIIFDAQKGISISELAKKYFLSEKSIQRIIREMKKAT